MVLGQDPWWQRTSSAGRIAERWRNERELPGFGFLHRKGYEALIDRHGPSDSRCRSRDSRRLDWLCRHVGKNQGRAHGRKELATHSTLQYLLANRLRPSWNR